MTKTTRLLLCAVILFGAQRATAQEAVDLTMVCKIREEGFQRSRVMEYAESMTDVLGPCLTGSPGLRRAEAWAKSTLTGLGLTNATIESWGEHGVGWTNVYTSLHLLEPTYQPVIGYPLAFTPGTAGKVTGAARIVSIRTAADFAKYRGTLAGAIVLSTPPQPLGPRFAADAERFSAEQLRALEHATIGAPTGVDGTEFRWDPTIKTYLPLGAESNSPGPSAVEVLKFFKDEQVAVVLQGAAGQDGTVFVDGRPGSRQDRSYRGVMASPPMVAVAAEAMRILKAIGAKPRRTIRIALWSFEEGRVVGSRAYVERHFGSAAKPGPDYGKLAAYFNVDNGAGRIRGIYLHGNERVRPIFASWLAPFADLEATTISISNEFGVDAIAFDQAGLPGFQFVQDPLAYESRTHHSNMDVFDRLPADDMRRNAVILASMVYHASMRSDVLPRDCR